MNRSSVVFTAFLAACAVYLIILAATRFADPPRGPGPNPEWITPGTGWICLNDDCRRESDAAALIRPALSARPKAWVFTFQRADQSVDYVAAPNASKCEDMRELYRDIDEAPSECAETP